jgi:hypothetical protein
MTDAGWKAMMTDADWKAVMDKSTLNAKEWIKNNSEHLAKLDEWLNTEVKVGNTSYNEYYDGNIRELIYVLGMQHYDICKCIKKKIREEPLNVQHFIGDIHFTPGDEVTAQNLSTLCTAIYKLDEDKVKSLHDMLCLRNAKGQSQFDWKAWGILVNDAREAKGYSKHSGTSASVSPWYRQAETEGGGRKLSRRRKFNPKSKSKHKHKRRSYKKSSYRRQRH